MKRTCLLSLAVLLAMVGLCEADWACPKCKKTNADDSAFCGKCGTKRGDQKPVAPPAKPKPKPPAKKPLADKASAKNATPLPPRAPAAPTLDEKVEKAIDAGIKYLWSQWNAKEAHWEGYGKQVDKKTKKVSYRYPVGSTALAAYALLEAGVTPQDERMGKTLEWMAKQPCTKTYSLGLRASAWHAANRTSNRKYIKYLAADAATLVHGGAHYGRYHYDVKGVQTAKQAGYDNSNSQYGVLGVWAAARDGSLEIPVKYWERVMEHWLRNQGAAGGWGYHGATSKDKKTGKVADATRPTMTTAGLATLYVCLDNLYGSRYITCRGNTEADIKPIAKGLEWLEKRFAASIKGGGSWFYYYLYCMERVGLASGKKYFGTSDWYRVATQNILPKQKAGNWGSVVNTSFALLFLVRGRHPVLFNRLQYDGDWNNRPRALASLTRWISRNFEKTVNWQVIDIRTSVEQWHDAPILCITGAQAPKFSDADIAKLRTYVQQGGTLFSVTECGGRPFLTGIRAAYAKMFPNYELVPLSREHPIYSSHFPLRGTPKLSMISNGVRPLVVHCDVDLAASWQLRNSVTQATNFQVAANVYMYVTAKGNLRNRAATPWPARTKTPAALPVRVARIQHNGNCNPEPLALARLKLLVANECLVDLKITGPIPAADLPQSKAAIAFLTGTNAFTLSPADTAALRAFCKSGGLLIIDAVGGAKVEKDPATQVFRPAGFAASAEALLAKMYPALHSGRLSSEARLLNVKEYEIDRVRYRADTRNRLGMMKTANLRAVVPGNRVHVIYSPEDLTAGLLGYTGAHVDGYTPESAYELVRNIILDAATRPRPTPKTTPPPAAKKPKP